MSILVNNVNYPINTCFDMLDRMYEGVDLTTLYKAENTAFSNIWDWIKSRIQSNNFYGIHVGDYIPFDIKVYDSSGNQSSVTMNAQVAGINIYKNTCDIIVGNHIDFICKECYPKLNWVDGGTTYYVRWNSTNTNNGNATSPHPWLVSNLYNVLNTKIYSYLPTELQNVIVEKRFLIESRYSASGLLSDSNGWGWGNMGKLWCPTEVEVYGCKTWGGSGYSVGIAIQYPVFANRSKIKNTANGRYRWWLATPVGQPIATGVCCVDYRGHATYYAASDEGVYTPVGFRIS